MPKEAVPIAGEAIDPVVTCFWKWRHSCLHLGGEDISQDARRMREVLDSANPRLFQLGEPGCETECMSYILMKIMVANPELGPSFEHTTVTKLTCATKGCSASPAKIDYGNLSIEFPWFKKWSLQRSLNRIYETEEFQTKNRPNCSVCKTNGGCEKFTMSTRGSAPNVLILNIKLPPKKRPVRQEIQADLRIIPPFLDAKSDTHKLAAIIMNKQNHCTVLIEVNGNWLYCNDGKISNAKTTN
jgi:hypothetical protein